MIDPNSDHPRAKYTGKDYWDSTSREGSPEQIEEYEQSSAREGSSKRKIEEREQGSPREESPEQKTGEHRVALDTRLETGSIPRDSIPSKGTGSQ